MDSGGRRPLTLTNTESSVDISESPGNGLALVIALLLLVGAFVGVLFFL